MVLEDQSTPYTDAVLQAVIDGAAVVVPAIWRLEVINSLVVADCFKTSVDC